MDALKRARGQIKGSMTRLMTYAKGLNDTSSIEECQIKLQRAHELLSLFNEAETDIFKLDSKEDSDLAEFEESYYFVIAQFTAKIRKFTSKSLTPQANSTILSASQQQFSEIRLPKINIPTFGGDYMQWQPFHDIYSATIHEKEGLTAAQKFQYLRGLLKGEAESLIRHIPISDANYHEAFQKLVERYDRKRHTVNCFIKLFMDQPAITQPTAINIRKSADTFDEVIRGLKAIGNEAEQRDPWLIYIALNKLDHETRGLWAKEMADTQNEFPTFSHLITFLNKRTDTLEALKGCTRRSTTVNQPLGTQTHATLTASNYKCSVCKEGEHRLYECKIFKDMPPEARAKTIKETGRCFNCLNANHRVYDCKSRSRCQRCHRRHHTMLHECQEEYKGNTSQDSASPKVLVTETICTKTAVANKQTILPTAMINIKDHSGNYQEFRALLDSASQTSFISESCIQKLNLKRRYGRVLITGLGETSIGKTNGKVELTITPISRTDTVLKSEAFIVPKVSTNQYTYMPTKHDLALMDELPLADPHFNDSGIIDVLLGADIFFKAIDEGKLQSTSGLIAINSIFGWIVSGKSQSSDETTSNFNILIDIDRSLRRFWEIEELPKAIRYAPEEDACEELYKTTTQTGEGNRFIVQLPFRQPPQMLGSSYYPALNRLKSIEQKFHRKPEFRELYMNFMREYESLGHMKKIDGPAPRSAYYLPHHGVLKQQSSSTKLRVVFDGSAKSTTGLSLNDILMVGPTVQPPLIEILIRIRQHRIVFTGDVEKMYRQVLVNESDCEWQNILWRWSQNQIVSRYILRTVTYGTGAAAYLSTRSIQEVGFRIQNQLPMAAKAILNDIYVDDLMTGTESIEEAVQLMTDVRESLKVYGFNLRKMLTNHPDVQSHIQEVEVNNIKFLADKAAEIKVLGLLWNPAEDTFTFTDSCTNQERVTKRVILSEASKNFDPLGFLSPITIKIKILFQNLWLKNLAWDDDLPADILQQWLLIREDMSQINCLRISRWLGTSDSITIHGFSDASEQSYAAVVYAVSQADYNKTKSVLIAAKSRVAPLKQKSLPRLELMGAALLTQLLKLVESSLRLKVEKRVLWTDSKIVLDWLSAQPRRWSTFVGNRTGEILENFPRSLWRHVPTTDNPADIATRGATIQILRDHQLWWNGPKWITQSENNWPQQFKGNVEQLTTEESRTTIKSTLSKTEKSFNVQFIEDHSSFFKMTKILAMVKRYVRNLNKQNLRLAGNTTRKEIEAVENELIITVQGTEFIEDLKLIGDKSPLSKHSKLRSLNPFLDEKGILRVGGRIHKSLAPFNVKHPIILPGNSHLAKCIVRDTHILYQHAGIGLLTSIVRRKYWITKAKNISKEVVNKCIQCIKQNPMAQTQIMGNLPEERVNFTHPFYKVGVDYCGPFKIQLLRRRGQVPIKAYVCVFVCLSTKSVHLETVGDMTTESFLAAISRFTARRGLCHTIYSDNGSNFIGANNYFKELYQFLKKKETDIASSLLKYKIHWKFIPPSSPHMGGIWEAAVKLAKIHLRRVVGETILTLEEFTTLLTKIEAILNSRPLAANQSDDIDCITPAHFLIGRTYTDIAEEDLSTKKISPNARWQLVRQMQQHFWQRWNRDYLTTLQPRKKWKDAAENLKVGDIVLVSENNIPSTCWLLGRIVDTHPGIDDKVRVVSIIMASSQKVIRRPIHKICKLPIFTQGIESSDSRAAVM